MKGDIVSLLLKGNVGCESEVAVELCVPRSGQARLRGLERAQQSPLRKMIARRSTR